MSDLISRQAAIDTLHVWFRDGFEEDRWWNSTHVLAAIEGLPSVQQERKTGKWILSDIQNPEDVRNGNYTYICSNCSHSDIHTKTTVVPFCWHCGADMRGRQDDSV